MEQAETSDQTSLELVLKENKKLIKKIYEKLATENVPQAGLDFSEVSKRFSNLKIHNLVHMIKSIGITSLDAKIV